MAITKEQYDAIMANRTRPLTVSPYMIDGRAVGKQADDLPETENPDYDGEEETVLQKLDLTHYPYDL